MSTRENIRLIARAPLAFQMDISVIRPLNILKYFFFEMGISGMFPLNLVRSKSFKVKFEEKFWDWYYQLCEETSINMI